MLPQHLCDRSGQRRWFECYIIIGMDTTTVIAKNNNSQQVEEENLLEETLAAVEELYNYRLAERLGRFVDRAARQAHLDAFAKRMVDLHHKMYRIRS